MPHGLIAVIGSLTAIAIIALIVWLPRQLDRICARHDAKRIEKLLTGTLKYSYSDASRYAHKYGISLNDCNTICDFVKKVVSDSNKKNNTDVPALKMTDYVFRRWHNDIKKAFNGKNEAVRVQLLTRIYMYFILFTDDMFQEMKTEFSNDYDIKIPGLSYNDAKTEFLDLMDDTYMEWNLDETEGNLYDESDAPANTGEKTITGLDIIMRTTEEFAKKHNLDPDDFLIARYKKEHSNVEQETNNSNYTEFIELSKQVIDEYEQPIPLGAQSCKDILVSKIRNALKGAPSITNPDVQCRWFLFNKTRDLLTSGEYHLHAGALDPYSIAPALQKVFDGCNKYLLENGEKTKDEYEESRKNLLRDIAEVG